MARFALITSVGIAGRKQYAGAILDDAQEPKTVAGVRAAGVILAPLPDALIEAAAAQATVRKLAGAPTTELDAIMLGAYSALALRNVAITQTEWHVNDLMGNDFNDGLTSASALKTLPELKRRFGFEPAIDGITVNVWIESDFPDEIVELNARFKGNEGAVWIHGGVKTVLATDTLTAWASLVAGTEPGVTGTSITDFTPYKGKRATLLDGTRAGDSFFFGETPNSGAGASENWKHGVLAQIGGGFSPVAPGVFTTSEAVPSVGSSFQIEDLFKVKSINLRATRLDAGTNGMSQMPGFIVTDLVMDAASGEALNVCDSSPVSMTPDSGYGQAVIFNCIINNIVAGTSIAVIGCAAGDQGGSLGGATFTSIRNLRLNGFVAGTVEVGTCQISDFRGVLIDNGTLAFRLGTLAPNVGRVDAGIWRSSGSGFGLTVDVDSKIGVGDVWGASTGAATGWNVDGEVFVSAIANMSSFVVTGTDVDLGSSLLAYAALPADIPINGARVALNP